ncbi:MAG: hypothetical protein EA420_07970 [Candidatus Competibacteraceae bacterium]|nr:MAG: hypothetical protein EA420_07970 [Candidatus Competibacteraceae bacterium]
MAVSSVLEGYLTIYGWQVYATLFLLLVGAGAVLYPVARLVFDAALGYAEGRDDPETGARGLIARLLVYVLVLVLGLIPIVPLEVAAVSAQNRCGSEGLAALGERHAALRGSDYGFGDLGAARVPLLPYLAMVLASGFNAVLYHTTPCLPDLTKLNLAMNTLDFGAAEDPNALRAAVERFERECGERARKIALDYLTGRFGPEGQQLMEERLRTQATTEAERRKQLVYFGSRFYREVFYRGCAGGGDLTTPAGRLCNMTPLRAREPVDGFPYDPVRDSDASAYQAATGQGFPTCEQWWSDPAHGLFAQLVAAGGRDLHDKAARLGVRAAGCAWPSIGFPVGCDLAGAIENGREVVVEQMLLAGKRQLGRHAPEVGWGTGLAAAGLFAFSDVGQNLAAQAAGYFATVYAMKIGSGLLQPFLLMTVFVLWGVFLVIGEMRGMALVKGLMLIFLLSILPGLWDLADYIDDRLFLALYPTAPPLSVAGIPAELMADHSTVERVLLLFVTMVFYLLFPLLMLYLIAEAGGPTTGVNIADRGMHGPARELGGTAGGAVARTRFRIPSRRG